jgi:hypothetical protein
VSAAANLVLYQLGWFACVLGAAHGAPWLGPLVAAAIVSWHLGTARYKSRELALLACAVALGLVVDSTLMRLGLLHFATGVVVAGVSPGWMLALWALFATTLNVSLRWLHRRPVAAGALGLLGGPLAYWAGARLGAISLTPAGRALCAVALVWAAAAPLLVVVARGRDGFAAA